MRAYQNKSKGEGGTKPRRANRTKKTVPDEFTAFVWQREPLKIAPSEALSKSERVHKLALGEVEKRLLTEKGRASLSPPRTTARKPAHLRVYQNKSKGEGGIKPRRENRTKKTVPDEETTFVWQREPLKRTPSEAISTSERVHKLALGEVAKRLLTEKGRASLSPPRTTARKPSHLRVYQNKSKRELGTKPRRANRTKKAVPDEETTFVWQREPLKRTPIEAISKSERVDKLALGEVAKRLETKKRLEAGKQEARSHLRGRRMPKYLAPNDPRGDATRGKSIDTISRAASATSRGGETQYAWRREPGSRPVRRTTHK
jgi:hypothetical protein